jgi:hypothetical protein
VKIFSDCDMVKTMSEELNLSVFEIIGSALAVASGDGQKVFERISGGIKEGKDVNVSFRNVQSITSAFLNAAIGQLYGPFKEEDIRLHLRVLDAQPDDLLLLKRVVDTAKEYFKDPSRFRNVAQKYLGEKADGK